MAARVGHSSGGLRRGRFIKRLGRPLASVAVALRNPRTLLAMAGVSAAAFCMLLVLAYASDGARWLDANALQGFVELQGDRVGPLARRLAKLGDPGPVVLMTAGLSVLAAAR